MNRFFTRLIACFAIVFGLFYANQAVASHAAGADIAYECLGNNQYRIIASFYRDCSGTDEPSSFSCTISSSCGNQSIFLNKDASYTQFLNGAYISSGQEISPLCPSAIAQSECNPNNQGTLKGIQVYFYTGIVTLQPNCGNYVIGISVNARNPSSNLSFPTSSDLYVEATLNSNLGICNSSPTFTSLPVPYYCVNQVNGYSQGAIDSDGDSLIYTLIQPLEDNGSAVPYLPGYTVSAPMGTNTPFTFNSTTGQMAFTPVSIADYAIAVRVDEYRNGVLIGSTIRDIQFTVANCSNPTPNVQGNLNNAITNNQGGIVLDSTSLGICPNTTVGFRVFAGITTGDSLILSSNVSVAIPGATVTSQYLSTDGDSLFANFSWSPTPSDTGSRYITFTFTPKTCPLATPQFATYKIYILSGTFAGPDRVYCINGGPVTVKASGGNLFHWTPSAGITSYSQDSSTITIVPVTSPASYYVTSDLLGGCKNKDTVVIITAPTFALSTSASEDTVCLNQSSVLTTVATPSSVGPITYSWTPGISGTNDSSVVVSPQKSTTYKVLATSAAGCSVIDSVRVIVDGAGPYVKVTPAIDYVCIGDSVQLNTTVLPVACGLNPNPTDPCPSCNFSIATLGAGTNIPSGAYTTNQPSPFRTYAIDARVQYIYRASDLDSLGITAGTITDIAFDIASLAGGTPFNIPDFSIKMGCTNLSQFPGTQSFVPNLPVVYSVPVMTTAPGWNTFSLDNPYDWDGVSNIIIEICYDGTTYKTAGYDYVNSTNAGFNATLVAQSYSSSSGCVLSPTAIMNLRPNIRFVAGSLPPVNYTYTWTPTTGLNDVAILNPKAYVTSDVDYTLSVSDGNCISNSASSLHIDTGILVTVGNDTVKCNSDSVMLVLRRLFPPTVFCSAEYTVDSIGYSPSPGAGTGTLAVGADQSDEGTTSNVSIPFPFNFYCNDFSSCNISSNGYISFGTAPTNTYAQLLPSASIPNNLIAGCWSDLQNFGSNRRVEYQAIGAAPNRKFIVRWKNAGFYSGGGAVNIEIQLHETTNIVEIHLGTSNNATAVKTVGLENANGTKGVTPVNRNQNAFALTKAEAWRFTPRKDYLDLVSVEWTPSTGLNVDDNDTVIAFPSVPTTYVAKATFSNGCINYDTITVGVATLPYTLTTSNDTICPGDSVTLSFNGAASKYEWTPAATLSNPTIASPVASPVITTNYQVKATSSVGCVVIDDVQVAVRKNPVVRLGRDTAFCYYEALTLTPNGGPFTSYDWSTGDTTPAITVNKSGDYSVLLEDRFCKFGSDTISVKVFPQISVKAYSDTTICVGDSTIILSEPGYSAYEWNTLETTPNITVSTAGQYSYIVTDNNNCRQQSNQVTVGINQLPVVNAVADKDTFCVGYGSLLTAGNDSDVVYTWFLSGSIQPVAIVGDTITAISGGTYIVEAARGGCKTYDSISVASKPSTFPQLVSDTTVCGCAGSSSLALSGFVNEAGLTYLWSNGAQTENTTVTANGEYSLTITNVIGCAAADTINVSFICLQPAISASPNDTIFEGDSVTLQASTGLYPSTSYSYLWSGAAGSISDSLGSTTLVKPTLAGQNLYTVWMTDSLYGCTGTDTISIYSIPPTLFIVPSVFSPNGDGVNDYFYPYLPNAQTMQVSLMHIYNRYGQLVYSCTNCNSQLPKAGWDGFYNNAAEPIGSYTYFIQIEGPDSSNPSILKKYFAQGSLSLIK